jgi:serine phosphatase RsbU (regulator of sigma subunit)
MPLGRCLCGHAASTGEIVFADCVDARHEVRYAGILPHGHYCVPILSGERAIGLMCLYVEEGHRRKPAEEAFLASVADVLAGTIHRKQSERRVSENEVQLLAAQRIQQHLLPKESPDLPGFDIAGASYPAELTGGDTFDYLALQDGSLGLAIGDVAGHGFAPALLMASTHASLRLLAQTSSDVGEILTCANRILVEETEDDHFVTFFLGRLDARTRSFTYCSAGHPTGYLLDACGNVRTRLESVGLPLGIAPDAEFAAPGRLPLEPGDLLLLVTDGIGESQSPQGEQFGDGRMLEIVRKLRNQPSRSIIESLHRAALDFCQREKPIDDMTVVVLKVNVEEK